MTPTRNRTRFHALSVQVVLGLVAALPALAALVALPAAAADVGVSVQISQPGVYGRIDIGRFPQPQVIVAQPVRVQTVPAAHPAQPVYLWVPPGHRKNWKKHCRDYGACGVPVYFVRHDWYHQHVQPRPAGRGRDHHDRHGHRAHERAHQHAHQHAHQRQGGKDQRQHGGKGRGRDD